MSKICRQLIKERPKCIEERKNFPQESGIYLIGKISHRTAPFQSLYLGQTGNIKQRIAQHVYGRRQLVDRELKKIPGQVWVKYVIREAPREIENRFIECMEEELGHKLLYNVIKGISYGGKAKKKNNRKRKNEE